MSEMDGETIIAFHAGFVAWVAFNTDTVPARYANRPAAFRAGFRAAAKQNDRGGNRPVVHDALDYTVAQINEELELGAFDTPISPHDALYAALADAIIAYDRTGDHDHQGGPYPGDCTRCNVMAFLPNNETRRIEAAKRASAKGK